MTPSPAAAVPGEIFREAMSRVAAAVHIIATDGEAGLGGATATAVTSVSDVPPSLLLCLNQKSNTLARIRRNDCFSVNVLAVGQRGIAELFSGAKGIEGADRFRAADGWRMGEGPPMLDGALAAFACRLTALTPVGSHIVIIGAVEKAAIGGDLPPLVYHRRAYVG
jgi:flavin reductase